MDPRTYMDGTVTVWIVLQPCIEVIMKFFITIKWAASLEDEDLLRKTPSVLYWYSFHPSPYLA